MLLTAGSSKIEPTRATCGERNPPATCASSWCTVMEFSGNSSASLAGRGIQALIQLRSWSVKCFEARLPVVFDMVEQGGWNTPEGDSISALIEVLWSSGMIWCWTIEYLDREYWAWSTVRAKLYLRGGMLFWKNLTYPMGGGFVGSGLIYRIQVT